MIIKRLLSLLAITVLSVACNDRLYPDDKEQKEESTYKVGELTLGVSLDPETRASYTQSGDGKKWTFEWEEGDEIGVLFKNDKGRKLVKFILTEKTSDNKKAVFKNEEEFDSALDWGNYAIYPYSNPAVEASEASTSDNAVFVIPEAYLFQKGVDQKFHKLPMIARLVPNANNKYDANFYMPFAVLSFTYNSVPKASKGIHFYTKNQIQGTFELSQEEISSKSMVTATQVPSTQTYSYEMPSPTEDNSVQTYYVPVPKGDYRGAEIDIIGTNINVIRGSKMTLSDTDANKVESLGVRTYSFKPVVISFTLATKFEQGKTYMLMVDENASMCVACSDTPSARNIFGSGSWVGDAPWSNIHFVSHWALVAQANETTALEYISTSDQKDRYLAWQGSTANLTQDYGAGSYNMMTASDAQNTTFRIDSDGYVKCIYNNTEYYIFHAHTRQGNTIVDGVFLSKTRPTNQNIRCFKAYIPVRNS